MILNRLVGEGPSSNRYRRVDHAEEALDVLMQKVEQWSERHRRSGSKRRLDEVARCDRPPVVSATRRDFPTPGLTHERDHFPARLPRSLKGALERLGPDGHGRIRVRQITGRSNGSDTVAESVQGNASTPSSAR